MRDSEGGGALGRGWSDIKMQRFYLSSLDESELRGWSADLLVDEWVVPDGDLSVIAQLAKLIISLFDPWQRQQEPM